MSQITRQQVGDWLSDLKGSPASDIRSSVKASMESLSVDATTITKVLKDLNSYAAYQPQKEN